MAHQWLTPDHLPRMVVELSPTADACADCGGQLRRIGEGEPSRRHAFETDDEHRGAGYVPGRFIVNRIVRPRLACACCERFVQAPLPWRPIERGRPGPGLLAHVLVSEAGAPRDGLAAGNRFADDPARLDGEARGRDLLELVPGGLSQGGHAGIGEDARHRRDPFTRGVRIEAQERNAVKLCSGHPAGDCPEPLGFG